MRLVGLGLAGGAGSPAASALEEFDDPAKAALPGIVTEDGKDFRLEESCAFDPAHAMPVAIGAEQAAWSGRA